MTSPPVQKLNANNGSLKYSTRTTMSSSRHASKRSARPFSHPSKKMKPSSPQADKLERKVEVFYDLTSSPELEAQPDSGYYENLDSDLDTLIDKSLPSYGNSNEDWVLYADEEISQDDGYYFQEEDAFDIASVRSVKANHGSYLDGSNNNESLSSPLSFENGRFVVNNSSPRSDHPSHVFTSHTATRDANVNTLQRWARTHEQHEELAYYFEQLPQTVKCPHQFQQSRVWNEVIDLSIYDIRD